MSKPYFPKMTYDAAADKLNRHGYRNCSLNIIAMLA